MISSMSAPPSSSSWFLAASSVVIRVEKATSEFLMGPDWTMNIGICDIINSNHWVAKEVLRALKKRLLNKNPKVQLLSLTLLETMVKNCVHVIHVQIAERSILPEMVKIVKKTMDTRVRDKILVLIDSWQEAFGGPGGKYPQYYWAYRELKNAGVGFPPRACNSAPIFTPPVSHPTRKHLQLGYETPSESSSLAAQTENLSFPTISSMRSVLNLLAEMLQAVSPGDGAATAVKDDVVVDLVERCRANHKKLMHMLTTTGDEDILAQGLELNDALQRVLAKHDAIASGTFFPSPAVTEIKHESTEAQSNSKDGAGLPNLEPDSEVAPLVPVPSLLGEEDEDEEDDFARLAQRHTKTGGNGGGDSSDDPPNTNNALVVVDPPPARTKEQDMIDLLSITLTSTDLPPVSQTQDIINETPGSQNSYVATWAAQPQPQPQFYYEVLQPPPQPTAYPQYYGYATPQYAATPGYFAAAASSSNAIPAWGNSISGTNNYGMSQVGGGGSTYAGQTPFVPSYRLFEDLNVLGHGHQTFQGTTGGNSASCSLYGVNNQSIIGGRK
ncbi:hypothetical protein DM860_002767 [Cuscuta australis]|uniref:VHS domain-containing protein n=1 Tax=Cuscuta australis TaxID=267555 RepID=A0A328D157_9ASTE|nr:hypothetical protein DM860_002767 [Cuscuta australis]